MPANTPNALAHWDVPFGRGCGVWRFPTWPLSPIRRSAVSGTVHRHSYLRSRRRRHP